jgi:hypothetical protein
MLWCVHYFTNFYDLNLYDLFSSSVFANSGVFKIEVKD